MRIAVSGSHGVGKSTLIASFLARSESYAHDPESYEALADEVDLTSSEGPTPEGLRALLDHSIASIARHPAGSLVIFERSPVDYLAYAAASRRSWDAADISSFISEAVPRVRDAMRNLDLIAFLPVTKRGPQSRLGESPRFRKGVNEELRRALMDDEYDLFAGSDPPRVVELSPSPERWLGELVQLTNAAPSV